MNKITTKEFRELSVYRIKTFLETIMTSVEVEELGVGLMKTMNDHSQETSQVHEFTTNPNSFIHVVDVENPDNVLKSYRSYSDYVSDNVYEIYYYVVLEGFTKYINEKQVEKLITVTLFSQSLFGKPPKEI